MRLRKRFIQSRRTYKDSTADENLLAERAEASVKKAAIFDVNEEAQLVPKELHDLARHINCRPIDPDEDFVTFDYHLCRLSHARSLVDLCLGELLSAFKKVHGEIGYSKIDDFADEHLSFSGRLASEMILNFERLQALPLLREACIKGKIVKSALRLLLRVMTKENEADLLAEIDGLSLREIEKLAKDRLQALKVCGRPEEKAGGDNAGSAAERAAEEAAATSAALENAAVNGLNDGTGAGGYAESFLSSDGMPSTEIPSKEADRDEGSGVVMKFNVPRTLALTWDFALEHFRENWRTKGPVYAFVEELVAGFMDLTADFASSKKQEKSGTAPAGAPAAQTMTLFDPGTTTETEPAFSSSRQAPFLYTKAIWDDFPSESALRADGCNGSQKSAETGCEYPDLKNEERLNGIREDLSLKPFVVNLPESYSQIPSEPYALSHKIIRVAQMRQSIDYHIGWLLRAIRERHLYRLMEFSKIEDYAKARINISPSTTFRLIKLVSYFKKHPDIEKAFLKRQITREQAFLVASLEDGRNERIWLDFAMKRPTRELREEVSRILRIKEFDYFAPHSYALLPGFRYITDDRYYELSDEIKDIVRTGAWYKGPGSLWPLASNDEYLLDNGFYNTVDLEMDTDRLSESAVDPRKEVTLSEVDRLSECAAVPGEKSDLSVSFRLSKWAEEATEEPESAKSSQVSKCAATPCGKSAQEESIQLSECAPKLENISCQCRTGHQDHSDKTLEEARALCTLPDKNRPAMTLLLDVLDSMARQDGGGHSASFTSSASSASSTSSTSSASSNLPAIRTEPTMPVRFYLPCELYGIWNDAVRRYTSLISCDDGVALLLYNEGVENFIAILLTEYLLSEKAHHKAAHNNKVLERDGYRCQVPGCSNRRNIHSHHLEFRSHGGCDAQHNRLSLCACHHLWILHILHGLKIEGAAPDSLTFTFGPNSGPEGQPFMVYSNGGKTLSPALEGMEIFRELSGIL
ncbi:MAG: HNH endonuclease [Candidatus Xenobiia bacterium LiM19]